MNDIQNQKQFSVDILDAEINGLAGFEQRRAEAYQLEDEQKRQKLTTLIGETMVIGSGDQPMSLLEKVQDMATEPDQERVRKARTEFQETVAEALKTVGKGKQVKVAYRILMDPTGQVTGIERRDLLSRDAGAEKRGHRLIRELPNGPKQNDTSGRVPDLARGQIRS